jgi:hypothetical protein
MVWCPAHGPLGDGVTLGMSWQMVAFLEDRKLLWTDEEEG